MELDETRSESGDKLDEHYCYVCNVVLDPPLVPVVEHPRGLPIPVCLSCEGKRAEKRLDPEDGTARTKAEFVESYGAESSEWDVASIAGRSGEGDDETDDACLVCGNGGTLFRACL